MRQWARRRKVKGTGSRVQYDVSKTNTMWCIDAMLKLVFSYTPIPGDSNTGHLTLAHNFAKIMFSYFQNSFTSGFSS